MTGSTVRDLVLGAERDPLLSPEVWGPGRCGQLAPSPVLRRRGWKEGATAREGRYSRGERRLESVPRWVRREPAGYRSWVASSLSVARSTAGSDPTMLTHSASRGRSCFSIARQPWIRVTA